MSSVQDFIAGVTQSVDARLDELLPAADVVPAKLHEAIRWSVFAGGKRFRPALLIACGEVFGASRGSLVTCAAAVEMIHTYSLIHDDLPAMDDDDLRRGQPTCHVKFGEATAILAGDVLQTLAFKAIAEDETLSAEKRLAAVRLLARGAGSPHGMVSGQQLDLDGEGRELSIDDVNSIHRQKTGALITASAAIGAVIGDASADEFAAIDTYASALGLLFQITDDLLDVTQDTAVLGKTAGKDASSMKATYPGLLGIDAARSLAENIRAAALAAIDEIERDTATLASLVGFVAERRN